MREEIVVGVVCHSSRWQGAGLIKRNGESSSKLRD